MQTRLKHQMYLSAAGCLIALILFLPSNFRFAALDNRADSYFREAILEAGAAYTTCRILNASISVVQESSLQLEPAGVGVSLAVGQVLDPVNDMTERLSDILVTAITSLGVQKLLYEISISIALPGLALLLLAGSILALFNHSRIRSLVTVLLRFALLLLVARVCLPLAALANISLHEHFFARKIETAMQELSVRSADLERLGEISLPEVDGVLGTIENSSALLKSKTGELKRALIGAAENMSTMVEALLKLSYLYIGMFLFQVILLPLISFWVLVKTGNALFNLSVPVNIRREA